MRKDPPFDMEYIYTTYILERAEAAGLLVVNRPQGLRDMNEKVYTAWFPQCCAPTLITRDMADMAAFLAEHGKIVCKPLDGMGGRSIFVLELKDKNARVVFETLTDYGHRFAIAQRYLPRDRSSGDARVLLIDGEPVPYALARIPSPEDHRGNLAAGAKGVGRPLNERDRWLAGQIGPALAAKGMLFVGLDVIGGFVTEINVTSPTGIRELEKQFPISTSATCSLRRSSGAWPPGRAEKEGFMARRALQLREGKAPVWDRLLTMLFLAGLLHGLVILGLTFNAAASDKAAAPGLEVLLVSDELPEADKNPTATYLAQRTQIGSGNTRKSVAPRNRAASLPTLKHAGTADGNSLKDEGEHAGSTEDERVLTTVGWSTSIRYLADEAGRGLHPRQAAAP